MSRDVDCSGQAIAAMADLAGLGCSRLSTAAVTCRGPEPSTRSTLRNRQIAQHVAKAPGAVMGLRLHSAVSGSAQSRLQVSCCQ